MIDNPDPKTIFQTTTHRLEQTITTHHPLINTRSKNKNQENVHTEASRSDGDLRSARWAAAPPQSKINSGGFGSC